MCTSVARFFFSRILLGQKDGETIEGYFFVISNFWLQFDCCSPWGIVPLKFPSKSCKHPKKRSSTVTVMVYFFRSDPNVDYADGLLDRAGVNYKWPVELGKCSKGSRGHPEADFFRRISCWPFSSLCLKFLPPKTRGGARNVSICGSTFFENPGQRAQSGNVVTPWIFALLHPQKFGCDWWWRQQKKLNGKVCGRFCIRFFYGTCYKGENCEFCHLEHKESKLKLDKVWKKLRKLFWCVF